MTKSSQNIHMAEGPFDCACAGTFSFGTDPASVLHSLPVCEDFTELEPDRFLECIRLKKAARGKPV